MASYLVPPVYAAFVWWFSTGAVLLLVGMSGRFAWLRVAVAFALVVGALCGLAASSSDVSSASAYVAFTSTVLLWGAQEIAFLAGWLTGPRPEACPPDARGARRLGFALQAILYHEFSLLSCGVAIAVLTWNGANQVGLWTFAALWVLRQSSKINLFLGVPVTNDELMPASVQFLKTYFAKKNVSAFFPISVTLSCAVLVIMIQRIVEVAVTPFEVASLTLVCTLFALGVVEHWFMLLPLPAITLWSWGMREQVLPENVTMDQRSDTDLVPPPPLGATTPGATTPAITSPQLVVSNHRDDNIAPKPRENAARQRLEDQFRQRFLEQKSRSELATAISLGAEPAATINGRTS